VAVDHGSLEAELGDATPKLVCGRFRILQRQMGETGIARRLPFDLARQKIVGRTG